LHGAHRLTVRDGAIAFLDPLDHPNGQACCRRRLPLRPAERRPCRSDGLVGRECLRHRAPPVSFHPSREFRRTHGTWQAIPDARRNPAPSTEIPNENPESESGRARVHPEGALDRALDGRAVIASDIADARVEVTALEDGTGLSIVERLADGTEGEVYTITPPVAAGDDIDLAATSKRR
jgi:hypothetical protein